MMTNKPSTPLTRKLQTAPTLAMVIALAALALPGCGPKSVKPGINDPYKKMTDVSVWTKRFEVEARGIFRERLRIIEALNLSPGMVVADIGAGTGLFVEPISHAVGDSGKLYAVDVTPKFIEHLDKRIAETGLKNVETVLCKEDSVSLPPNSIDLAFICDVYHHFEFPEATMSTLHDALRPGGEIVIVDFHKIPGVTREWIMGHVRANQATVIKELHRFGFEMTSNQPTDDFLDENYMIRVKKVEK